MARRGSSDDSSKTFRISEGTPGSDSARTAIVSEFLERGPNLLSLLPSALDRHEDSNLYDFGLKLGFAPGFLLRAEWWAAEMRAFDFSQDHYIESACERVLRGIADSQVSDQGVVRPADQIWTELNGDRTGNELLLAFCIAVAIQNSSIPSLVGAIAVWKCLHKRAGLTLATVGAADSTDERIAALIDGSAAFPTPPLAPREELLDPASFGRIRELWFAGIDRSSAPLLTAAAALRIVRASQSPDTYERDIALGFVKHWNAERLGDVWDNLPSADRLRDEDGPRISAIVPGTNAWIEPWWRPRGDFHEFVKREVRPDLYSGGARFAWSGYLSGKHRMRAALDLHDWIREIAPNGVRTLFGHSYGGEIIAAAWALGARVDELVLLSTPVTPQVEHAAKFGANVVDIRLRFDIVLFLASVRQEFPPQLHALPNFRSVILKRRYWSHGATHSRKVWLKEKVRAAARL